MSYPSVDLMWLGLSFIGWFLLSYYWHGVGITLGYHRLLTHKSLKVPKWVGYFWVAGAYLCLMGAPLVWVGVHRLHHQKSDQEGDPHSPTQGFIYALYGWMFNMAKKQTNEELRAQVPDLIDEPLYSFLGCGHDSKQALLCLCINVLFRVILFFVAGPVAVVANLAATFCVFWSTQLVNTVCHLEQFGYRSHNTRENSRNVWWVALLAVGEGWHNNHHAYPKAAQAGFEWYEFDITWYTILVMEKLGLATQIVRPPASLKKAARKAGTTQNALSRESVTEGTVLLAESISEIISPPVPEKVS